jgi:hypothetical protein
VTEVKIKEGIIEVDGKPFHASELFLRGKFSGYIAVNKYAGVHGALESSKLLSAVLEYPGILVVGEPSIKKGEIKLEIVEYRKNLLIKTPRNQVEAYEVLVKIDNSDISLTAVFYPKRITIYCEPCSIKIDEKPYMINVYIRSPE